MPAHRHKQWIALLACVLLPAVSIALAGVLPQAQQQQQGQQPQGQQPQDQKSKDQQQQDQKAKDQQQQQQQQGGGLFGGMKRATGVKGSKETEFASTGGAKGVGPGDGKKIAAAQPTAEDRQKVEKMASAVPSADEMKKFLEEGHLSTEKKGGK